MRISFTVTTITLAMPLAAAGQTPTETAASVATPAPAAETLPTPTAAPAPPAAAGNIGAVAPPAATTTPAPPAITFGWEALVDAYYLYNFTGDPRNQAPLLRQFDSTANNFALSYAKLGVHAETALVSFRMDLGGGHTAAIINGASGGASLGALTGPGDGASLYGNAFLVEQAFATVRPASFLSIDAGKFVTSASAEVIEANRNWLYSRSLLFFGVPLLHTGLRLNLAPTPALAVMLELCNGWNNDPDNNNHKTFGGNVTFAPPGAGLAAGLTAYVGKEGGLDGDDTRLLLDGVVLKDIGNLSVGLNLDYFKRGDAYWFGGSAMGRFILSDLLNLAARAEYLRSKNGAYIAPDGSVYEFTGMLGWTMDKHYELRLEMRADLSDEEIFLKGTTPRKNQVTGLLAALAYF